MEQQKGDVGGDVGSNRPEPRKEDLGGDTIVEQGSYNMIATTDGDFKITHLVLKSDNGSKRVWRINEMSEKDISFKIEKFG